MKSIRFSFGRVAGLLLAMFVLSGFISCIQTDPDFEVVPENVYALSSDDSIVGTWTNTTYNEKYVFGVDKVYAEYSWEIETPYIYKIDATSGIVYGKYTKAYEETNENPNDDSWIHSEYWIDAEWNTVYTDPDDDSYTHYESWYRYSNTAPDAGKWYAVYYSQLQTAEGKTSAKISGAYNSSRKTSTETLEEAVAEFTPDNHYFDYGSVCTKE